MSEPHIVLKNATVRYPIVMTGAQQSLFAGLANTMTAGRIGRGAGNMQFVTALNGINLEIRSGDRIGLIGRNGAGKSTLLKMLAGILPPTRGSLRVNGTSTNILSMGSGMDLDLNGFENIERMSRLLDIPKSDWKRVREDVEEFTELGKFLGLPVRT